MAARACWHIAAASRVRKASTVASVGRVRRRWCSTAAGQGDVGTAGGDGEPAGASGAAGDQPLMPGAYPATRRWSDKNTFVPAPDTAAAAAAAALQVPVIDFGPVSRAVGTAEDTGVVDVHDPAQRLVVDQIAAACRTWGFFSLGNHGVEPQLLREFMTAAEDMFALPQDVKHKFMRSAANSRGFFDDERTKQTLDWKQGYDMGHMPRPDLAPDAPENHVMDGFNQWPQELPHARAAMERYYDRMAALSARLMQVVALGLSQDAQHFDQYFTPHTSFQRINYYPACPRPDKFLAVNPHKDAGALTMLLQDDVAALQVNHGGDWVTVDPVHGTYTVNVGDMLEVWTNGRYPAPEHRVLARADSERFSAPFFYNPSYDAHVAPLSNMTASGSAALAAPRFRPVHWGEFRRRRFEGDLADVGREIQISDFLIEQHA